MTIYKKKISEISKVATTKEGLLLIGVDANNEDVQIPIEILEGDQGEPGVPGQDGPSAYEVAVAAGYVGTQEEWLLSLVGPQGEPGETQDLSSYTQSDGSIKHIVAITQEAFDTLLEKDPQTLYFIKQA